MIEVGNPRQIYMFNTFDNWESRYEMRTRVRLLYVEMREQQNRTFCDILVNQIVENLDRSMLHRISGVELAMWMISVHVFTINMTINL